MTFPRELIGAVWHTTSIARFAGIVRTGHILAKPDIPDCDRFKTSRGPDYYPYVRTLGGISLFDFRQFDETEHARRNLACRWQTFVPYRKQWGEAIWIEIAHEKLASDFISASELIERWKTDKTRRGHDFMPHIEGASLSPIPDSFFNRVLKSSGSPAVFESYEWSRNQAG